MNGKINQQETLQHARRFILRVQIVVAGKKDFGARPERDNVFEFVAGIERFTGNSFFQVSFCTGNIGLCISADIH